MLRITLSKAGEPPKTSQFDKREITVGRTSSNDLAIPEPGVSSSHARILYMDGELTLIDLESTNGTFVNGKRIQGPQPVQPSDEVYICAHKLVFEFEAGSQPSIAPAAVGPVSADAPAAPAPMGTPEPPSAAPPAPLSPPSSVGAPPQPPQPPQPPPPQPPGPPAAPPNLAPVSPVGDLGGPAAQKQPGEPTLPPMIGGGVPGPAAPEPPPSAPPPLASPPPADVPPAEPGAPQEPMAARSGDTVPPSEGIPSDAPASVPPPPSLLGQPLGHKPPSFHPTEPPDPTPPPEAASPSPPPAEPAASVPPPEVTPKPNPPASSLHDPSLAPNRATVRRERKPAKPPEPAPPPEPPPPRAARPSRPPQALYEPSEDSLVSKPPSSITNVGDLDSLNELDADARVQQVCARVFGTAFDNLSGNALLTGTDKARALAVVRTYLTRIAGQVEGIDVDHWTERLATELTSVGSLAGPLGDTSVDEILVRGPGEASMKRGGKSQVADVRYSCAEALDQAVRRLTESPFDRDNPVVDETTSDGTEVFAVHSSIARGGPVVTVRPRGRATPPFSLEKMLQKKAMKPKLANFLSACVQGGLNVAICAGPGARGLELLAALAETAPRSERQVFVGPRNPGGGLSPSTIVLSPDPSSSQRNPMTDLVTAAGGLGPDRLLVHDVAGEEAAAVFAAMGRVGGTILTTRAGNSQDGFRRLCAMLTMGDLHGDASARASYVAGSLELIVSLARFPDGQTRITQISEPCLSPDGTPQVVHLFTMDHSTRDWTHTGVQPTFGAELRRRGIVVDLADAPASDRTQMAPGAR